MKRDPAAPPLQPPSFRTPQCINYIKNIFPNFVNESIVSLSIIQEIRM